MSQTWVNSLDMLSANGVLDYDGAAFLHGTAPRYIGNPAFRTSPQPPPPSTAVMRGQPEADTYSPAAQKPLISNPAWKKVLFAGIAGTALIFGAKKFKKFTPLKWINKQFMNIWDFIKRPFTKKVRP